jgi:hypothetical protein
MIPRLFLESVLIKVRGHTHCLIPKRSWTKELTPISQTESEASKEGIQIGFPILPKAGSPIFELLREWLRVCDRDHEHRSKLERLPTRVLDVGDRNSPGSLHLYCTQQDERGEYIALSHQWGKL